MIYPSPRKLVNKGEVFDCFLFYGHTKSLDSASFEIFACENQVKFSQNLESE